MGERIELLGGILRRRIMRAEQQWALTQPFIRQLSTTEAQSLGRDVDDALKVLGVPRSLRLSAEQTLPALTARLLDNTSSVLKALSSAASSLPETQPQA